MSLPKSICDDCANIDCLWMAPTGGNDPPIMVCPQKIKKPKTNADHIRAMTDEELAMWIKDMTTNALSILALGSNKQTKDIFYWLDWLKQET